MRKIEIDDELYTFILGKMRAFEETPSIVLRRELGLNGVVGVRSQLTPALVGRTVRGQDFSANRRERTGKGPKVDLVALISSGVLRDGQTLFLYDYQRKQVPGYEAKLASRFLIHEGRPFSMSDLARQFLQKEGYQSNSVRGPMHWGTAEGVTIRDMWEKHLERNGRH